MTTSADSVTGVQHDDTNAGDRRYDLQLLLIALALLAAILTTAVLSVPIELAMVGPAVTGTAVMIDGLFVNPPETGSGRT